jgi:putative FmdB family regulatory protein
MPIYEFYCPDCHTIFNFFSSRINTDKRPHCPRCDRAELERRMSVFAVTGRVDREEGDTSLAGLDESQVEAAFTELMQESASVKHDDPQQIAALMRKFSQRTGVCLGEEMEKVLSRLEAGEDPEAIEQDLGDLGEEAFSLEAVRRRTRSRVSSPPRHDDRLYEL